MKSQTKTKQAALDEVAKAIVADKVTPELAKGAIQLVPGEGNPDAEVMFVGEAPGKDEDAQGRPFVGVAGKLLTQMIEELRLKRSDVYITNIVKYRPPANRDPLPAEAEAFMPYLLKQIAVIKPKLIVPLGRHALSVFLPQLRISAVHGQPKRKNGQVYLPLYHPAVVLYDNSKRQTLEEDFAKIPRVLALI